MSSSQAELLRVIDTFLSAREANSDFSMEMDHMVILLDRARSRLSSSQTLRWLDMIRDRRLSASPRFLRDILDLLKDADWQEKPSFLLD